MLWTLGFHELRKEALHMVYVGMDVHRKRTQVAVLDERGEEVLNRNLPNDRGEISPLLLSLGDDVSVVFEAAYGWGWLADLLNELEVDTHLAHAKNVKAIASARLKNDKVDARTLAHLLRTDLLPESWLAPKDVRDLRALLRHRARLVRYGTSLKARIHAVLADQGIRIDVPRLWTKPGRGWLDDLELPAMQRSIVEDLLGILDATDMRVRRLDHEIKELAKPDERVDALRKLPGIGLLSAMMLVAEIGDISRFASARKLCAWAGLTPQVRNSDRTIRHGHITKQGSAWVRWVLGEAAQVAKSRPPFAMTYAQIAKRRGNNIATIAIARKLLARCFHVLKEVDQNQIGSEEASVPGALAVRHGLNGRFFD
jgi:transposase